MGLLDFLKGNKEEKRATDSVTLLSELIPDYVTEKQALEIPTISACLEYVGNKVAMLPLKLYCYKDGKLEEIKDDARTRLFNVQPSELFDAFLFKKMLAKDYMLHGSCYAYLRRRYNEITEVIYIPQSEINVLQNYSVLNRQSRYLIQGVEVSETDVLYALKDSEDGVSGKGLLNKNAEALKVAYAQMQFEKKVLNKQGTKRGFFSSEQKLSEDAMQAVKQILPKLCSGESDNTVMLNAGIKFNEIASTPAEMQIVENKQATHDILCNLCGVAPSVLNGTADADVELATFETAVLPVAKALEAAINRALLLEREKNNMFFAFDTDEALKANMEIRYSCYEKGIKNGFLQTDEVREKEHLAPLGVNYVKLGLQDVLFDPKKETIYIPNMGKSLKMGGEWENEN